MLILKFNSSAAADSTIIHSSSFIFHAFVVVLRPLWNMWYDRIVFYLPPLRGEYFMEL